MRGKCKQCIQNKQFSFYERTKKKTKTEIVALKNAFILQMKNIQSMIPSKEDTTYRNKLLRAVVQINIKSD